MEELLIFAGKAVVAGIAIQVGFHAIPFVYQVIKAYMHIKKSS